MTAIDDAMSTLEGLLSDVSITINGASVPVGGASTYMPEVVTPPFLMVGPSNSEDLITFDDPGLPLSCALVHMSVLIVVPQANNQTEVGSLNEAILQVVAAIREARTDPILNLGPVGRPGVFSLNGQNHLAATVDATAVINL